MALQVVRRNENFDLSELSLDVHASIVSKKVNETIEKRKQYAKDTILQTLRAGKLLASIRSRIDHFGWSDWVNDNTDYSHPDEATRDIRFWEAYEPFIDELVQLGIITDAVDKEDASSQFVQGLDDDIIQMSQNALRVLGQSSTDGMPIDKGVRQAFFEYVKRHRSKFDKGVLDRLEVKRILEVIDASDEVVDKDRAKELVKKGVRNPAVIRKADEIDDDTMDEMNSGSLYVPQINAGQGRDVPIEDISPTDLELRLQEPDKIEFGARPRDFAYVGSEVGMSAEELLEWVQGMCDKYPKDKGIRFKLNMYISVPE